MNNISMESKRESRQHNKIVSSTYFCKKFQTQKGFLLAKTLQNP